MNKITTLLTTIAIYIITSLSATASQLRAGYAEIDISPKQGDTIQVMTGQQKQATTIHDPLLAKAIYLDDGQTQTVLMSLDLIGLYPTHQEDLTEQVKALANIEHLILTVTHTHSGILSAKSQQSLPQRLANLIQEAKARQQQVNVSVAQTQFNEGYNRIINNNGKGQMLWSNPNRKPTNNADLTLGVVNFTTLHNRPFITLINYNVHPVITMNRQDVVVSADYPGRLAHYLKHQYGSDTLFMLGAAGDINPFDAGISDMGVKPLKVALDSADRLGKVLANKVIAMVNNSTSLQQNLNIEFKSASLKLDFVGNEQIKQFLTSQGLDTNNLSTEINTLTIGKQLAFASFGGEFFSDFKQMLAAKSSFTHTFFIGYANGNLGYIPTLKALKIGGYGAESSQLIFAPYTGKRLIEQATKMLK